MVKLRNVSFKYQSDLVFDDLNIQIAKGEFLCILGSSGSGKSTLLNLIAGILKPVNGEVICETSTRIGFVFQDYSLFPWLTVEENAGFGLKLKGINKTGRFKITDQILKSVFLFEHRNKFPHELSGGMKQRVSIARVIANQSNLLLMDEPFGALDQSTRTEMQDFIQKIWISSKKTADPLTIIFITHNIEEAYLLGSRVILFPKAQPVKLMDINIDSEVNNRDLFTNEYGGFRRKIINLI